MANTSGKDLVQLEAHIRLIRGVQVILDTELAEIYGVPTRALNQAVRRNLARFPADFAFQLSRSEVDILRSQIVISSSGHGGRRHSPWAFTEHGAIMAASLLNTSRAVEMSVFVVRAFVRLKELTRGQAALAASLAALERKVVGHDEDLKVLFAALRVMSGRSKKSGRPIGLPPARGTARSSRNFAWTMRRPTRVLPAPGTPVSKTSRRVRVAWASWTIRVTSAMAGSVTALARSIRRSVPLEKSSRAACTMVGSGQ